MTFFNGKNQFKEMQDLARRDGAVDQDHAEDMIIQTQGLCPVMRPSVSLEQSLWVQQSDPTKLEKWTAKLEAIEESLVDHQPRWVLLTLLGLALGVEFESGVLYWRDQGVLGVTRLVMAAATAGTSIFLPWLLVELAQLWKEER